MLVVLAIYLGAPAVLATVAVSWWVWREGLKKMAVGLVLVAVSIETLMLWGGYNQMHYWDGYDLNPRVRAADVAGTWTRAGKIIELRDDGTFSSNDGTRGQWAMGNGAYLRAGSQRWKVLSRDGQLLLLAVDELSDPDEWNRAKVFSRR